ncbi:hypothetical protein [Candidatus Hodgkinia cicadicola]|uniref:hypothetical protein n=1 Tax=Candidatus Hodgkinia cicadicola TaxID=573658 RepID=UPI0011BA84AB
MSRILSNGIGSWWNIATGIPMMVQSEQMTWCGEYIWFLVITTEGRMKLYPLGCCFGTNLLVLITSNCKNDRYSKSMSKLLVIERWHRRFKHQCH